MAFNFGEEPLKYPLPNGYVPIKSAPSEKIVMNINGADNSEGNKVEILNNAPQALIIEVVFLSWILYKILFGLFCFLAK